MRTIGKKISNKSFVVNESRVKKLFILANGKVFYSISRVRFCLSNKAFDF